MSSISFRKYNVKKISLIVGYDIYYEFIVFFFFHQHYQKMTLFEEILYSEVLPVVVQAPGMLLRVTNCYKTLLTCFKQILL